VLLVGCLLLGAFLLRLDGITQPSIASRELYGALITRQHYFGDGDALSPSKQRVVGELSTVFNAIEPPVLNVISAFAFQFTGGENLWVPRVVPALLWVIGGIFLYLIAGRLTTRDGMLVALVVYLFWPFGVWISRHGMPDAMMVALLLAAALTVIRYWERPSLGRLASAGVVSSLATAAKPGVALIFLTVLFAALAISQRAFLATLVRGRLPLFVALAISVSAVYYAYGAYVRDFLSAESEGRIEPELVTTAWFWKGWWSMMASSLPFPQSQGTLALVSLAIGLFGVIVARQGMPRAVLVGLALGYLAFGLTFTTHVSTHSYYSLPLIPILALSTGVAAGFLLERLRARSSTARFALVALVALAVGIGAFKSHAVLTSDRSETDRQIADYRRIGEITRHTTRALVVDVRLISPISYWGWIVARYWYEPTPEQDLGASRNRLPGGIDPAQFDFLIVVDVSELESERRLRGFTRGLPVVERTGRYAVFDLRRGRKVVAEARPRLGQLD
jgi:4-amino-4-deoxy-L-arabinose transferase-like glycosyltransferase